MTNTSQERRRMTGGKRTKWGTPADRDAAVLAAGVAEAREVGFGKLTRDGVARRGNIALGTVNTAFGTVNKLRDAIMLEAVRTEDVELLAQGLAERHCVALDAPDHLKRRAADSLTV